MIAVMAKPIAVYLELGAKKVFACSVDFPGWCRSGKDEQLALEALPGLIERVGDVRFLVAGSGTAEAELRAQASQLGLDPHGTFLGWIGDDVLRRVERDLDLEESRLE